MESLVVNEYLKALSADWLIFPETWGISNISGHKKRIDAVIISKQDKNIKFGIEFKRIDIGAFNNFTAWFRQSLVYTQCNFGTIGKIPILIAPSINYEDNLSLKFFCDRIIGEFGIGQIERFYNKEQFCWIYKIKISGNTFYTTKAGETGYFNKSYTKMDFNSRLEL